MSEFWFHALVTFIIVTGLSLIDSFIKAKTSGSGIKKFAKEILFFIPAITAVALLLPSDGSNISGRALLLGGIGGVIFAELIEFTWKRIRF